MYMMLVYYAIKFLIIYLKRYFTLAILAVLSPVVALSYAIEKINKKGKKAAIYSMWIKDFIYTALLQSAHALIYAVFIGTALKLTESSLMGIALSLVFLHFMSNAEKILRKILAFSNGAADLMNQKMSLSSIASATVAGMSVKRIASSYAKGVDKVLLKPVRNAAGKGVATLEDRLVDSVVDRQLTEEKEKDKEREKIKQSISKVKEDVKNGAQIAKKAATGVVKGAAGMAALVIEPGFGIALLSSSASSFMGAHFQYKSLRPPTLSKNKKKYTFNGVVLANQRSVDKLMYRLDRDGINYTVHNNVITAGRGKKQIRKYRNKYTRLYQRGPIGAVGRGVVGGLKLATGIKFAQNLMENEKNRPDREDDIRDRARVALYSKAKQKENDIMQSYREARARQDELISKIEEKNPDLAGRLRAKQDSEMEDTMLAILTPVPGEDIETAISSYVSRNPEMMTGTGATGPVSDAHIRGIQGELNKILEEKQSRVRVSENFVVNLKSTLSGLDTGTIGSETDEGIAPSRDVGQGRSRTGSGSRRSGAGRNETRDSTYNPANDPNASRNAPTQNAGLNTSTLASAVQTTLKQEGSTEIRSDIRIESLGELLERLRDLEDINEESRELGDGDIYDLDEVVKRLKSTK